jgi:tRNA pseudouridine32 synthase / 23S rRNA pseudouridine746 synthase
MKMTAWSQWINPAGLTVVPARLHEKSAPLVEIVSRRIGKKAYVVHRLDRETSGIVLFAKDAPAHRELCLHWEKREVGKIYRAAVLGRMSRPEGMIDLPIKTFGSGRMGVSEKGKPSQTRFRVLGKPGDWTFLEVKPLTGRRHQIRVHLFQMGCPVIGDPLYGKERPVDGILRLMLHACQLVLPFQNREIRLMCEPGRDFMDLLKGKTDISEES